MLLLFNLLETRLPNAGGIGARTTTINLDVDQFSLLLAGWLAAKRRSDGRKRLRVGAELRRAEVRIK